MSPVLRWGVLGLLAMLLALAGWRILGQGMADSLAATDPQRALAWNPGHPAARLAQARALADAGQADEAAAAARALLEDEPLQPQAWQLLGELAAADQPGQAAELHARALQGSPRLAGSRAWLAQWEAGRGDADATLAHLDRLLHTHPGSRPQVFSYLGALAADPVFRTPLVQLLATRPPWREGFLQHLRNTRELAPVADAVQAELQAGGQLGREDYARWIEALLQRGDWSQAYARWAGSQPPGARLAPVYNGDFGHRPEPRGFDWRSPRTAGLQASFPAGGGARIEYRNRRIDQAGLEQALLLAPGRYRLQAKMQSEGLRSDRGLEWVVQCAGNGAVLGRSDALRGSHESRMLEAEIQVPAECNGQWLRLRNAVRVPALQAVSGRVTVQEVAIMPLPPEPMPPPAPASFP